MAAGLSTRMGDQKLLMEVQGSPLVVRSTRAALESELRNVVVVLGPHMDKAQRLLASELDDPRLSLTVNPRPSDGMSSSLTIGVASLTEGADGTMILLADQPLVTSQVIDRLIEAFSRNIEMIVLPTVNGRRTTPVIFPRNLRPELMKVSGDKGGRDVVKKYSGRVAAVEMGAYYNDSDVDTRDDLDAMRATLAGRPDDALS